MSDAVADAAHCTPAAPDVPAIQAANVTKVFTNADRQPLTVLDNVTVEVGQHEIVAILGASGCGKSTLLNIISGLLTPERGAIRINGLKKASGWVWQ